MVLLLCVGGGSFMRVSIGIVIIYLVVWIIIVYVGFVVVMRMFVMIGLLIVIVDCMKESIVFVCCRCLGVVSCGMMFCIVGSMNVVDVLFMIESIVMRGMVVVLVNRRVVIVLMDRMLMM